MEKYEYLPRLIIAYNGDSNDENADLIQIKKSEPDKDYYCPCCGGVVKPRVMDSNKVQPHYYHINGDCSPESQIHWFYKNWLFKEGIKFIVDGNEVEVKEVEIEKTYNTPFGDYRPDITVTDINDKIYFFEIFFTNRKRENDYFCKWRYLDNPVIQIEIKEYMAKTSYDEILVFNYLYNEGKCYQKEYKSRDSYINGVYKRITQLSRQEMANYKSRVEKLDYFWQMVINRKKDEELINTILDMEFDDAVFCYGMVKKQQCTKYLADVVLEALNKKTLSKVKEKINFPQDDNVYLGLYQYSQRTFEIGIIIDIDEPDMNIYEIYEHCSYGWCSSNAVKTNLNNIDGFPKVIFKNKLFTEGEIQIPEDQIDRLKEIYNNTIEYKNKLFELQKKIPEDCKLCFKNGEITVYINDDGFKCAGKIDFYHHNLDNVIRDASRLRRNYIKTKEFEAYYESVKDDITLYEWNNDCKINAYNNKLHLEYKGYSYSLALKPDGLDEVLNKFSNKILDWELRYELMDKYISLINGRAKMWRACTTDFGDFKLSLVNPDDRKDICYRIIRRDWESEEEFIHLMNESLEQLLWDAEEYHGIRFMEGK